MPDKQIGNPAGSYGLTADPQEQWVIDMVNNSGGTLQEGDMVICTDVAGINVTTTTSVSSTQVVGVVGTGAPGTSGLVTGGGAGAIESGLAAASSTNTFASGATMPVVFFGPARVNIAANTVAAGAILSTSAAAKVGAVAAAFGSVALLQAALGSFIAIAQESQAAKDANNTIRCMIMRA
jgi:hypothetical protein